MNAIVTSLISLIGLWNYNGFYYEGLRYGNPNPDLHLSLQFKEDGTNRLRWWRDGQGFGCERIAEFRSGPGFILHQRVIWVNPKNGSECATDPDMVLGAQSTTPYSIHKAELWLHLQLNGTPFYYILIRGGYGIATDSTRVR